MHRMRRTRWWRLIHSVVINGTADGTAPTLTSATVVGTAVKLNFSEVLQTTDTLTNSLFTVEYSTDGGLSWSTQTHSVNGNSSDFTNGGATIAVDAGFGELPMKRRCG